MIDIKNLKAIAEACKGHQPLRFMPSHGALYIRNDNGIVFDVHQNRSFPDFMAQNKDYADLVLAANPAVVLALIAERDQLKAEYEVLNDLVKRSYKFVAFAFDQGLEGSEDVGRDMDLALSKEVRS